MEIYQSEFLVREHRGMEYSSHTQLRVESNVAANTFVGNQITNVLREIQYVPSHIQYIPVRQQFFDIVEVDLRKENG